ncbi:AAA family ATPase [Candidatus Weimeria sp. HCP3S3_B5]|uniref:ATP-binding protein n=1 Tax=Candidatus Weimeria sp. HCP3S3_B5 TaxID=3438871 RepID=UPI003F8C5782
MARRLPIGKQNFKNIRENGYVYVDKTRYVWDLANSGLSYFLSRPRRFGKSLFISTLESYFSGEKELFKGLYIEEKENEKGADAWAKYPIISFYLSGGQYNTPEGLGIKLSQALDVVEEKYGLKYYDSDLSGRFENIIRKLYEKTGRQVVVLVDEYDKPLLSTMISNTKQEEENRQLYKGFFSVLKDMDGYLKFVFFTGVTKFSKVSIFSDLNQLKDISMDKRYSGICGITEGELTEAFEPEIGALTSAQGMTHDECMSELAKMYDGYHFSAGSIGVYNPFSLLNAFDEEDFGSYWFETGTPDILIKKLETSRMPLYKLSEGVVATESALMNYRVDDPDPIPLFYQSGYLTICDYDREFRLYTLKLPNNEVKYGFFDSLVPSVLGQSEEENPASLRSMLMDLRAGKPDSFVTRIRSLFASIPYPEGKTPVYEGEWSRQLYLVLSLMGAYTQCEVHMATGRADCVVKTSDYIYVFEFKLDAPVEEAMKQIDDKGYTIPYIADSRKLYKVGVVFSTEKRNVVDYEVEESRD